MIPWSKRSTAGCSLVGFNLQQACFNLENTCVMYRECSDDHFDGNCTSCLTGRRPFINPRDEPAALFINGQKDNPDHKTSPTVDAYDELDSNYTELVVNATYNCHIEQGGMPSSFGGVAGFVKAVAGGADKVCLRK